MATGLGEGKTLFILCPTTGQVHHKAFCKVGPDAGPQTTCVRQNPKLPSAPSAFPQLGRLRRQEIKQQTIGKTEFKPLVSHLNINLASHLFMEEEEEEEREELDRYTHIDSHAKMGWCLSVPRLSVCLTRMHMYSNQDPHPKAPRGSTSNCFILFHYEFTHTHTHTHTYIYIYIRNMQPKLNRINFETSANVLKCL